MGNGGFGQGGALQPAVHADEFAEYLTLTRPYLSRVVLEVPGMPRRDFLRQRQLVYARYLLETTPLSTVQVALAAAFGPCVRVAGTHRRVNR